MPSISVLPPLPGFRQDLNHASEEKLFPCALLDADDRLPVLTLREIAMLQFMNQITDKIEWERKVFDESIVQKWKTEILEHSDTDFTREMADYCIEELKYKARVLKKTGFVRVYNGDVIKSDRIIPAELRDKLKAAIVSLEDVPTHNKDWHPGSDNQVLDLVHPSLFPLVYGTSRILVDSTVGLEDCISRCGHGDTCPYSMRFQWLPCDVDISGDKPKFVQM